MTLLIALLGLIAGVSVCAVLGVPGFRDGRGRTRWALALLYVGFGGLHLAAVDSFLPILPPQIPFARVVVLFTGLCEVAGGAGLILPATRRWAGALLGVYAVCVFPANLYHAFAHVTVPGLPSSWWYHAPRLLFQPVFVWWALYAGEVVDWPFSPHRPPFAEKVIGSAGEA